MGRKKTAGRRKGSKPKPAKGRPTAELRRPEPSREPLPVLLIACEDERSAPAYFRGLEASHRQAAVAIAPHLGTDPASVVEAARSVFDPSVHDEAWCVFDTEGPHRPERRAQARGARERARALDYRCALSNPSFEYWLLLHFERTLDSLPTSGDAESRLRVHLPRYAKGGLRFSDFSEVVEQAIKNASELFRERCPVYENDPCECHPCTEVFRLVRRIIGTEAAARRPAAPPLA